MNDDSLGAGVIIILTIGAITALIVLCVVLFG